MLTCYIHTQYLEVRLQDAACQKSCWQDRQHFAMVDAKVTLLSKVLICHMLQTQSHMLQAQSPEGGCALSGSNSRPECDFWQCSHQPATLDKAQTRLNICKLLMAMHSTSEFMQQVWSLRVDVHILDHNGNLADAASPSALAALLAFRRPEVTLEAGGGGVGQQVVVHPPDVREPLPLSIHHTPLCITFASFQVPIASPYCTYACY